MLNEQAKESKDSLYVLPKFKIDSKQLIKVGSIQLNLKEDYITGMQQMKLARSHYQFHLIKIGQHL